MAASGPTARRLITNMAKGELDPLLEGRPDLASYFEGASKLENWIVLRQGGVTRRPGLLKITEVRDSDKDTILLPFEAEVDEASVIEMGDGYARFIKNKQTIISGSLPVEIATPYTEDQIRNIHYAQNVDVMFLLNPEVPQQRLISASDTSWSISAMMFNPPPTFEADTDISGGTVTLTPSATTGAGVTFTASSAVFLSADVGRQIIFGASRGTIVQLGPSAASPSPNTVVLVDIIDAFPNTSAIPAGSWFLRLSPQTALNVAVGSPVHASTTMTTTEDTFRAADVGKYVSALGGLAKIITFNTAQSVIADLLSVMPDVSSPAAAGTWTLEVPSWSAALGYPRTPEFYQNRFAQASTFAQPTTFWLSASDLYDDYAVGTTAERAIQYTMATRGLNRIEWLADNTALMIGTAGSEHAATSGKSDEAMGGDKVPLVDRISSEGSFSVQPIIASKRVIFVDRSRKRIFVIAFDIEEDGPTPIELTAAAGHITGTGVRLGSMAFVKRVNPTIYIVREDGQLLALTYYPKEKVIGFTRLVTQGTFEAVAAVPKAGGGSDQVYVVVKRTINGQVKRFIELFEEDADDMQDRAWTSLNTDCAVTYNFGGTPTTVLTGLDHLEGEEVYAVVDGQRYEVHTVNAGQITLMESGSMNAEVGLYYSSEGATMRPAVEGLMVEGLSRSWSDLSIRVKDTLGGKVNGVELQYAATLDQTLFTGDKTVNPQGLDTDGRIEFQQHAPYPMTILALFGTCNFGMHG